jgi:hypothetical protein
MPDEPWASAADFSDPISAEAVLGLPRRIVSNEFLPGAGSCFAVCVPISLLHRARWVLPESQFSDAELTYLATGELPDEASGSQP